MALGRVTCYIAILSPHFSIGSSNTNALAVGFICLIAIYKLYLKGIGASHQYIADVSFC